MVGNVQLRGNLLLQRGAETLQARLPAGWVATARSSDDAGGAQLQVTSPRGERGTLSVVIPDPTGSRLRSSPSWLLKLVGDGGAVAIAPWLSRAAQEVLLERGNGYIDLTGNVSVELGEPGLFVRTVGALKDPAPREHETTLRGAKAAGFVRTLAAARTPIGIRELARQAGTTPGYASKLATLLEAQSILARMPDGAVGAVRLQALIRAWAEQVPLSSRTASTSWLDPRGLSSLLGKLPSIPVRYAVTGSIPAALRAPVAASRTVTIYVDDAAHFASVLGLRPADAGANVVLLTTTDDGAFEDTWSEAGVRYAALPQVAADLLTSPGRGPAEAEALLAWMEANRGVWVG